MIRNCLKFQRKRQCESSKYCSNVIIAVQQTSSRLLLHHISSNIFFFHNVLCKRFVIISSELKRFYKNAELQTITESLIEWCLLRHASKKRAEKCWVRFSKSSSFIGILFKRKFIISLWWFPLKSKCKLAKLVSV